MGFVEYFGGDVLVVMHLGVIWVVELSLNHDGGVLLNLGVWWIWVDVVGLVLGDWV